MFKQDKVYLLIFNAIIILNNKSNIFLGKLLKHQFYFRIFKVYQGLK